MKETEDRQMLIRYLLDDLSESEQDRVEKRYFVDDEFYTKILVAEDELIDSYVQGELSQDEQKRFDQVYMTSPSRRKKVEANRHLLNHVLNPSPTATLWYRFLYPLKQILVPNRETGLRYSLAGLLLIGVLCGLLGWLLFERGRIRSEMEQARAQWQQKESEYQRQVAVLQQQPPSIVSPVVSPKSSEIDSQGGRELGVRSAQEPGTEKQPVRAFTKKGIEGVRVPPSVVAFGFPHAGVRTLNAEDRAPRLLVIPRGSILVRLTVGLVQNEYAAYSLSLRKVGGPVVWSQSVPRNRPVPSADQVEVDLPAALFQSQDYILQVTASDPAGEDEILARHQITAINRNLGRTRADGQPRR